MTDPVSCLPLVRFGLEGRGRLSMSYQPYSSGAGLEVFLVAAVFGDDQGGEPQFLFDFGSFPSAGYGAMFQSHRFKAYASGTEVIADNATDDNFLHLYRVRFDLTAGQLSIYRDGQLLKSAALSATSLNAESIDEAEAFTVGGQASAGSTDLRYFRGIFGELLLFNGLLDDTEAAGIAFNFEEKWLLNQVQKICGEVTPAMWLKADELSDPVATWKDSYQNELLASQANPAIVTTTDSPFVRTVQFGPITPLRYGGGLGSFPPTLVSGGNIDIWLLIKPDATTVQRQFIFSYGTFPSAGIAVTVDNTLHIHACGETVDFDPSYFLRNELALYEIYFQRESGGGLLFGVNGPEYGAGRRADGWTADYLDDAGFVIGGRADQETTEAYTGILAEMLFFDVRVDWEAGYLDEVKAIDDYIFRKWGAVTRYRGLQSIDVWPPA